MQPAEAAAEAPRNDDFTAFPVSYVDEGGIWKDVEPIFRGCMPLRNLNWKRKSSGGQYLLGSVELAFFPHDSPLLNWGTFLPLGSPMVNFYRKPYLYLYFAICDDNDTYKEVLRPKLLQWTAHQEAKSQEWLIIHVQGRQTLGKSAIGALNSAFNRSPFDKIRDDFKRVVQLRLTEKDEKRKEMVDGLGSKLSEYFLSALDLRVSEYEEELRKMLARRMVPGWNYCTFFLVKEALAIICEAASLLDESLLQYTELEVLFNEEVNGKQPNHMAVFFPPEPEACNIFRWELVGLLSPNKRPFRELLSKNSISAFEFHEYLFARQVHLLFGLDRINDVTSRAQIYIADMERRFRAHAASTPPLFADAWVCCTALTIVSRCTAWYQAIPITPSPPAPKGANSPMLVMSGPPTSAIPEISLTSLSSAEADLYYLARLKLDRLGAQADLLQVNGSRINMGRIGLMTAESLAQPPPALAGSTTSGSSDQLRPEVRKLVSRHVRQPSGQIRADEISPPTASIDLNRSDDAQNLPLPLPALTHAATFASSNFPSTLAPWASAKPALSLFLSHKVNARIVRDSWDSLRPGDALSEEGDLLTQCEQTLPRKLTLIRILSERNMAPDGVDLKSLQRDLEPPASLAPPTTAVHLRSQSAPEADASRRSTMSDSSDSSGQKDSPKRPRRQFDPPVGGPGPGAQVQKALSSRDDFDRFYVELSEFAAFRYRESFRSRHVIMVNNDVASLYMERKRHADAEALLKSISQVLFSEGWNALNLYALAKLAECQRALNHHGEYITTCLNILSLPVDPSSHLSQEIARFYQNELIYIAVNLQQSVTRDMQPIITVSIGLKTAPKTLVVGELLAVDCELTTALPEPITLDSVQLKFNERSSTGTTNSRAAVMQSSEGIDRRASLRSVFVQSEGKVTLLPGARKTVRLEKRVVDAGEFTVEKIQLHLGQLVLSHALRQVPLSISVAQSHPSLELSLLHDDGDRQIIGQQKPIHFVVKTNSDAVQSGNLIVSLLVGSTSQLSQAALQPAFVIDELQKGGHFLLHRVKEDLSQAKKVAFALAPASTSSIVIVPLSNVPPNHLLHFYVPLFAPVSREAENIAFKKEISCKLKYLKVPDGQYEVELTEELKFQPPFTVTSILRPISTVTGKESFLLQVEARNALATPASLQNYGLDLTQYDLLQDHNKGVLRDFVLPPREALSLTFIVAKKDSTAKSEESPVARVNAAAPLNAPTANGLVIKPVAPLSASGAGLGACLSLFYSGNPTPFFLPLALALALPQQKQVQIEISARFPSFCTVASFFSLEYVVQRPADDGEAQAVQVKCEVAADSKEWLLAGRRKHSFALRPRESTTVCFKAMAVRCGYLLLPALTLHGVQAVNVDRGKQIHIFPQPHRPLVEIAQHAKSP